MGSGALGLYYGARLVQAGANVRFLARADLAVLRQRRSIRIQEPSGTVEVSPIAAFATSAEVGPVDLVVVSLKTTSASQAHELIAPLVGDHTAVLTLQNGFGADEFLGDLFGRERILGALVFMAVNRTAPGEVRIFHPGSVSVGELGRPPEPRTHALAALLARSGMKSQVVENLAESRWRKLVWNIPFNGLSIAEGGITTDRICADPSLAAAARTLMLEVQRAAAGFGFVIPDAFVAKQFEITPPMGPYRPSSLVDFLAGREVEVEAIWGEPLRRAAAVGIAMPALESLYGRLRALCPEGVRPAGA